MIILITNPITKIVNAKVCKFFNGLLSGFRVAISMNPISTALNHAQLTISVMSLPFHDEPIIINYRLRDYIYLMRGGCSALARLFGKSP